MQVAPPPSSGPRIQELGDTLVVTFRARRSWGELLFLGFWLTFWTFGGIAALYGLARADWGGRVFLLVWLCGWAVGEAFAASQIAWQLAGSDVLTLTPNELEARKQVGPFAWRQRLHVLSIDDVSAERVPTEEDEKARTDYRLRIVTRDATLLVGEGMGEYQAETLVLLIRERFHPRRAWRDDDPPGYGFAPAADASPATRDSAPPPLDHEFHWGWVLPRIAPALIGTVVIAFVVIAVLRPLRHPPHLPRFSPPPAAPTAPPALLDLPHAAGAPPLRRDFHDPRSYAVAMTDYSLGNGHMTLESAPRCAGGVTWTRWICHARATSHIGPFAGRSLVYACVVADTRPGSPTLGILYGPEHPPPITP
jgi:hypothetical protein